MSTRTSPVTEPAGSAVAGGPSIPIFALFVAVVVAYAFCTVIAAQRNGDFVHLWIGGRLASEGRWAELYDVTAQSEVLARAFPLGVPPSLWASRNYLIGVFFYPPSAALLYSGLGSFLLPFAAGFQALLNTTLALGAAALLKRLGGPGFFASSLLILLFPPFFYSYVLGQNGVATLVVLLLGGLALARRWSVLGGLLFGLLAVKPSWLVAVAWLPLLVGGWRMALGMAIGAASTLLLSLPFTGPGVWLDWLRLMPQLGRLDTLPDYPLHLQFDGLSVFRRAFGIGARADVQGWITAGLLVAVSVWRGRRLPTAPALGLGLAVSTFINPHLHHYDMLPTLVGLGLMLAGWRGYTRGEKVHVGVILAYHHLALLIVEVGELGESLPLPALSPLLIAHWWLTRPVVPALTVAGVPAGPGSAGDG